MKRTVLFTLLVSGAAFAGDPGAAVVVTGTTGADEAYRVDTVRAVGPLGTAKLQDQPHSMVVLPGSLIRNAQATSVKEALKYVPLAQFQEQQGSEVLRPATRGMQGSNYQNTRMDGMTIFVTGANAIESLEQIEVFSGLPATMYGPSNPAGMFNFVSKRPTDEPLRQLEVGYNASSIYTAHADLGGKLGDHGEFGYRLNLLDAHGASYVSGSSLDRKLGSVGLDLRPAPGTTIELNGNWYQLVQKGYPGWFTYSQSLTNPAQNVSLPAAPDPTRRGYGQSYAGVNLTNQAGNIRLLQNLGADWVLVVGLLTQGVDRNINTAVNVLDNAGNYTSSFANGFAPHFGTVSNIAYLNGSFDTGRLHHELSMGTTGFKATSNAVLNTPSAAAVKLGTGSINNPGELPEPAAGTPDVFHQYRSSLAVQQGFNVSDMIHFSKQWAVSLALSQDWMQTQNFKNTGAKGTSYNKNGVSPMPSLIYKPRENVTTYLTYASSLQQGDIAPAAATGNANMALAPYRSTQWEAGIKATVAKIDLTFAAFRLERPFANTDPADNVYKISGQQINKGIEATAIGKAGANLTVVSGITLLDPIMDGTGKPATNDKQYTGMPKFKSNILLEYAVPPVAGLVGTVDWQYTARRPGNDANTTWAPSCSVLDVGARYTTRIGGKPTTLRLAVNNVTDEHYWSTIGPANLTGVASGSMTAHLGAPRTVAASLSTNF